MANLPESSSFDAGVYQLELTDPVIGGPSGVSNAPLKNLANRTRYLKDHVDNIEANFAPKASPAFSGTPVAPTPAQFDNDTSLATTAFVQRAIGNAQYFDSYVSSAILAAEQAGKVINYYGGAPATITLPPLSAVRPGCVFYIFNTGGAALTVSRYGADVLQIGTTSSTSSVSLNPGSAITLCAANNGVSWHSIGNDAHLPFSPLFASSLGGNGYKFYPDKNSPTGMVIEQWGVFTGITGQGNYSFSYPIAFPNAMLQGHLTMADQTGGAYPSCIFLNSTSTKTTGYATLSGQGAGGGFSCRFRLLGY